MFRRRVYQRQQQRQLRGVRPAWAGLRPGEAGRETAAAGGGVRGQGHQQADITQVSSLMLFHMFYNLSEDLSMILTVSKLVSVTNMSVNLSAFLPVSGLVSFSQLLAF